MHIAGAGFGWLCFGFGLFAGMSIVLVISSVVRVTREDNDRMRAR